MSGLIEEKVRSEDMETSNDNGEHLDAHHAPVESPAKQEAAVAESPQGTGEMSNDTIEHLVTLFRDFLEAAPNSNTADHNKSTATRKKLFGLTKTSSPETGSNNPFDYEQKYPRDRHGQELAENARVWLTYLDEAGAYDRDKVEGWKDTVDVLLVFAGLFSGVITTFVSQASQNLQQNYTQVSASLLFQMAQVQLAQFSGTPIIDIPNSTLIPVSPFSPSTNALLVNGLWFTSLAISLTTAFFAVLTKQWLYYYMSVVPGTALDKVRVRHFRFQGLELWKVGLIVDLLPVLLHLALGVFLIGIILFLFPLDIRVASIIVVIASITYVSYFISVILPIRYPDCPYTTSLTIYVGSVFYFFSEKFRMLGSIFKNILHRERIWYWRVTTRERISRPISRLLRLPCSCVGTTFRGLVTCLGPIHHIFRSLGSVGLFINWREENLNKFIQKNAVFLDCKALSWLYAISSNPSVRRIIARGVSVHPALTEETRPILEGLQWTLNVSETNLQDLCYGLYMDLPSSYIFHWNLLKYISNVDHGSRLNEVEYQSYSRISTDLCRGNYNQFVKEALRHDLKFRLVVWRHFFTEASGDDTLVAHILTSTINPFYWDSDPERKSTYDTDLVLFGTEEQYKWIFEYLFRFFCGVSAEPDYSSESQSFETRYLLLISIYNNLTSNRPTIPDGDQRQTSLEKLFWNFNQWLYLSKPRDILIKQYFSFFQNILCVEAFRNEPMTGHARRNAVQCLDKVWYRVDTNKASHFPFRILECQDLSLIYKWGSRDFSQDLLHIGSSSPIVLLLFMPQNRARLLTILSADSDTTSHFLKCLKELRYIRDKWVQRNYVSPSLMDLFRSVDPTNTPLFTILYDTSVLVQAWRFFVYTDRLTVQKFLVNVKFKLGRQNLENLHADMIKEAQSEGDEYRKDVRFIICIGSAELKQARRRYLEELYASLDEFGRNIGVSSPKLESFIDDYRASEGNVVHAEPGNHDTEACPQEPKENECESSIDLIVHRI